MTTRTSIGSLGRAGFIERLTAPFHSTVVCGIGDDAAVVERQGADGLELISQTLMLEGTHFDLSYTPLEHLGLKLVTRAVSNIYAMNGRGELLTVSVGLSARFAVEEAEALYRGVELGCARYGLELIGGDTAPSLTGLTLSATCIGSARSDKLTLRSGAEASDLICVTGSLGGAYMGLQLLEREKRAGASHAEQKAIFESHRYILDRQLQPQARLDILELLSEYNITPTAMIDVCSGLSSATLHLCRSSAVGVDLFLDKIPVHSAVSAMAAELNSDPLVAILNGGEDFELLFTASIAHHKDLLALPGIHVIGYVTENVGVASLITPDGEHIALTSQDFNIV